MLTNNDAQYNAQHAKLQSVVHKTTMRIMLNYRQTMNRNT